MSKLRNKAHKLIGEYQGKVYYEGLGYTVTMEYGLALQQIGVDMWAEKSGTKFGVDCKGTDDTPTDSKELEMFHLMAAGGDKPGSFPIAHAAGKCKEIFHFFISRRVVVVTDVNAAWDWIQNNRPRYIDTTMGVRAGESPAKVTVMALLPWKNVKADGLGGCDGPGGRVNEKAMPSTCKLRQFVESMPQKEQQYYADLMAVDWNLEPSGRLYIKGDPGNAETS